MVIFLFEFYEYVYALRVLPAETRLTVYRRLRVTLVAAPALRVTRRAGTARRVTWGH